MKATRHDMIEGMERDRQRSQSQKIRILATQGMGWKAFGLRDEGYGEAPCPKLIENVAGDWNFFDGIGRGRIWNPFASLDQCAGIEARLNEAQWKKYSNLLYSGIVGTAPIIGTQRLHRGLISLSAAQRSEALVEVLNA